MEPVKSIPLDIIYKHSDINNNIDERNAIEGAKVKITFIANNSEALVDLSKQLKGRINTLNEEKRGALNYIKMASQGKLAEWKAARAERKALEELYEYTMNIIPHTDWNFIEAIDDEEGHAASSSGPPISSAASTSSPPNPEKSGSEES